YRGQVELSVPSEHRRVRCEPSSGRIAKDRVQVTKHGHEPRDVLARAPVNDAEIDRRERRTVKYRSAPTDDDVLDAPWGERFDQRFEVSVFGMRHGGSHRAYARRECTNAADPSRTTASPRGPRTDQLRLPPQGARDRGGRIVPSLSGTARSPSWRPQTPL